MKNSIRISDSLIFKNLIDIDRIKNRYKDLKVTVILDKNNVPKFKIYNKKTRKRKTCIVYEDIKVLEDACKTIANV